MTSPKRMHLSIVFVILILSNSAYSQLLIVAKEFGKKYGYIDVSGSYQIAPQYEEAFAFHEGYAIVKKGGKYGLINTKNDIIVPIIYDNAVGDVNQGKITLYKGDLGGVIDVSSGKTIIPHKFRFLSVLNDGHVVAFNKCFEVKGESDLCEFSVYDSSGNEVLTSGDRYFLKFDELRTFVRVRKGLLLVHNPAYEEGYQEKILDVVSKEVIEFPRSKGSSQSLSFTPKNEISEYTLPRSNLMAVRLSSDSVAYFDQTKKAMGYFKTKFIVNAKEGYPFYNGIAVVERNGFFSLINESGETIKNTELNSTNYSAKSSMHFNGLIGFGKKIGKSWKAGFVDTKGSVVIPFQFDDYHPFEFDVTPVKLNGKYGLIKKDGSWAIEPKFEKLSVGDCPCFR